MIEKLDKEAKRLGVARGSYHEDVFNR